MKNQVQVGHSIDVAAPTGGAVSGVGYLLGAMFGIWGASAAAGVMTALHLVGVYTLPKNSAEAWTVGQAIYWDNTNFRCTTTSTSNTKIGVATAAAANPSSSGNVRLNGAF